MGTIESSETPTMADYLRSQRVLAPEDVERVESAHQTFPAYRHEAH